MSGAHRWTRIGVPALVAGLLGVVAAALPAHSGFEPVTPLRESAPALALMAGAACTHAVARARAARDAERQADPQGRALFLGALMVVVTLLCWLAFVQGLPALYTARFGELATEAVRVVRKVPVESADGDCTHRLEVQGSPPQRSLDECVPQALWQRVSVGDTVQARVRRSRLGQEIIEVGP